VDTTKTTTHVSLCAGYGGIDLGLSRAIPTLRTIAFSEIEAFACANLVSKMEAGLLDAAPIWTNLKTFPWSDFRDRVDILSGGYPCQPFSAAGKRLGRDDPRHLWPWIANGIVSMRPRICFFENVEGHISLGLREVISELEELGYKTAWGIFSAREVGAPHQRKRVFILAHLRGERLQGREWGWQTGAQGQPCGYTPECGSSTVWPSRPGEAQHEWEPPRVVGNAILHGHATSQITGGTSQSEAQGRVQELEGGSPSVGNASDWSNGQQPAEQQGRNPSGRSSEESGAMDNSTSLSHPCIKSRSSEERHGKGESNHLETSEPRQAEPSLGGDSDGPADWMDYAELCVTCDNRTDELRLLGNGVVPATATRAFLTLMEQVLRD